VINGLEKMDTMKKMDMLIVGEEKKDNLIEEYLTKLLLLFRECYMNNFVPKCLACKQIIVDTYIQALGGHYHKNCFVCQVNTRERESVHGENRVDKLFRNVYNRL